MALRDTWHKTLVYFGLAEPDDGYAEEPEPEPESVHRIGSPQPRASARAMFPEPMKPTRMRARSLRADDQDWLKKPFSISLARSSAETSTLRGVSRNTLSAIRCMPPSRA